MDKIAATRPSRVSQWLHQQLKLPYRLHVHGDYGDGPTIILLHGIASSSASWQYVVPLLMPHYRCITIDLLGFGSSPKPEWESYTPDQHIKHLHHTIKKLHLRGPIILVGHSLGSLLALHYAKAHPKKIARVVMLSPPIYIDPLSAPNRRIKVATNAYLRAYRYIRRHKKFTITNASRISRMLPIPGALALNEHTWLPFCRSLEECIERQTVANDIRRLTVTVDIFYGAFDEFIIKANIISLNDATHITLHRLPVRHIISRGYAQAIAKILIPASNARQLVTAADTVVTKS